VGAARHGQRPPSGGGRDQLVSTVARISPSA
jgi:hypothetical protein